MNELFGNIPLWGLMVSTIALVGGATEVGYRSGLHRLDGPGIDNETQVTAMTGAHLGLLAFILAFSFSMAAGHFDARKQVIMDEANAIETAYLRTILVGGPRAEQLRALLIEYAELRGNTSNEANVGEIIRRSEALFDEMWQQTAGLATEDMITPIHSLLIQSLNDIYDIHQERLYAGVRNRIPPTIWIALYVVLTLSMAGMGFNSGIKGSRTPLPSAALALSFSMVFFLIADLDRPKDGLLMSDQSILRQLSERLQKQE